MSGASERANGRASGPVLLNESFPESLGPPGAAEVAGVEGDEGAVAESHVERLLHGLTPQNHAHGHDGPGRDALVFVIHHFHCQRRGAEGGKG